VDPAICNQHPRQVPSSNVNSGLVPVVAAITTKEERVIRNTETGNVRMYNIEPDSMEQHPSAASEDLLSMVENYWATPPLLPGVPVDGATIQSALRDLGYF